MAIHTVIADVGTTLIELLRREMQGFFDQGKGQKQSDSDDGDSELELSEEIVVGSPADLTAGSQARLSLFLYRIEENDYLRNQETRQPGVNLSGRNPIFLDLFYMITAYSYSSNGKVTDRNLDEHRTLGLAVQTFYDNAVLRGSALRGSLAGTDTELRIIPATMNMENVTQIWNSFESKAYKPSVFYKVTPVPLDSARMSDISRVIESSVRHEGIIDVRKG